MSADQPPTDDRPVIRSTVWAAGVALLALAFGGGQAVRSILEWIA